MTSHNNNEVKVATTDTTLILGAEAYIQNPDDGLTDPTGEQCFQTFTDLILNSDTLYISLPNRENGKFPLLIDKLDSLKELPEAKISLSDDVEEQVRQRFVTMIINLDWIAQWLRFQLLSPIVKDGHDKRLYGTVSPDGLEQWQTNRQWFLENLPKKPGFTFTASELSLYSSGTADFSSVNEFLYCYTFDVYRRGWQYLAKSQQLNVAAIYFPHALRNSALNACDAWMRLGNYQNLYWSWGRYISLLFKYGKVRRSVDRVADYILAIRTAYSDNSDLRWNLRLDPTLPLEEKALTEAVEKICDIADRAKLPQVETSRLGEGIKWVFKVFNGGLQDLVIPPFLKPIVESLVSPVVKKLDTRIVEQADAIVKQRINSYFKGTYGYPGLVSKINSTNTPSNE